MIQNSYEKLFNENIREKRFFFEEISSNKLTKCAN